MQPSLTSHSIPYSILRLQTFQALFAPIPRSSANVHHRRDSCRSQSTSPSQRNFHTSRALQIARRSSKTKKTTKARALAHDPDANALLAELADLQFVPDESVHDSEDAEDGLIDEFEASWPSPSSTLPRSPYALKPLSPVARARAPKAPAPEDEELANNPWAQVLASPIRACAITGARLPAKLLVPWGLVRREESEKLWFTPVGLLDNKLKRQIEKGKRLDRDMLRDKKTRADVAKSATPTLSDKGGSVEDAAPTTQRETDAEFVAKALVATIDSKAILSPEQVPQLSTTHPTAAASRSKPETARPVPVTYILQHEKLLAHFLGSVTPPIGFTPKKRRKSRLNMIAQLFPQKLKQSALRPNMMTKDDVHNVVVREDANTWVREILRERVLHGLSRLLKKENTQMRKTREWREKKARERGVELVARPNVQIVQGGPDGIETFRWENEKTGDVTVFLDLGVGLGKDTQSGDDASGATTITTAGADIQPDPSRTPDPPMPQSNLFRYDLAASLGPEQTSKLRSWVLASPRLCVPAGMDAQSRIVLAVRSIDNDSSEALQWAWRLNEYVGAGSDQPS